MQFRCPECNQVLLKMTPGHAKKHGYSSLGEFFAKYPQILKIMTYVPSIKEFQYESRRKQNFLDKNSKHNWRET